MIVVLISQRIEELSPLSALPSQTDCQSLYMAARDSEERQTLVLSLAQRLYSKSLSMYNALNVKSRVRGDFHARFCERVEV